MPTYEIEHAGSKYEVDTDTDLSPSEMKDLFQAAVNAGAIESSPGVGRQGTYGKASVSLDPIERPVDKLIPRLASDVQEAKIAGTPGFLESVQSVFQDRNEERKAEAQRPKGFLDSVITGLSSVGSSARDTAGQIGLSPLTIPKHLYDLGKTADKRYKDKGLGGGKLPAGDQLFLDALDQTSNMLPFGQEIKTHISGGEKIGDAIERRLQEDPAGLTLDALPVVGGMAKLYAKGGAKAYTSINKALGRTQVEVPDLGYRAGLEVPKFREQLVSPEVGRRMGAPAYHEFPEPGMTANAKLFGGRPGRRGVTDNPQMRGGVSEISDDIAKEAANQNLVHANLERISEDYKIDIGNKADWYESWLDAEKKAFQDPNWYKSVESDFKSGKYVPGTPLGRLEMIVGSKVVRELEVFYDDLMQKPVLSKAEEAAAQMAYKQLQNTLKVLYRDASDAGRKLNMLKIVIGNPNSFANVMSRVEKITGSEVSERGRRKIGALVRQHQKNEELIRAKLMEVSANSEDYINYILDAVAGDNAKVVRLEKEIGRAEAKLAQLRAEVLKKNNLAHTLTMRSSFGIEPTIFMGADDLATGSADVAIKAAKAAIKKAHTEKLSLSEQIKKKMAEKTEELQQSLVDAKPFSVNPETIKNIRKSAGKTERVNKRLKAKLETVSKRASTAVEKKQEYSALLDEAVDAYETAKTEYGAVRKEYLALKSKTSRLNDMAGKNDQLTALRETASKIDAENAAFKVSKSDLSNLVRENKAERTKVTNAVKRLTRQNDELQAKLGELQVQKSALDAARSNHKAATDAMRGDLASAKAEAARAERLHKKYTAAADKYEEKIRNNDYSVSQARSAQAKASYDKTKASTRRDAKMQSNIDEVTTGELGKAKPVKAKPQRLGSAFMLEMHDAAMDLDRFARKLREKYGDKVNDTFIRELYTEAQDALIKELKNPTGEVGPNGKPIPNNDGIKARMMQEITNEVNSKLPVWKQTAGILYDILDSPRAVMATLDLPWGRQAAILGSGRPVEWIKSGWHGANALVRSIGITKGAERSLAYVQEMEKNIVAHSVLEYGDENYYTNVAGIKFNELQPDISGNYTSLLTKKGDDLAQQEEFKNPLVNRIPGVRSVVGASERAYAANVNYTRAKAFDGMFDKRTMSAEDAEAIGRYINVASGQGWFEGTKLGENAQAALPLASLILFSPKFTTSRAQYLALGLVAPFGAGYGGSGLARRAVAKEYWKTAAALGTFYAGVKAAGLEIGRDPTSSTFGAVHLPSGAWLDPLAGEKQMMVLIARYFPGRTTSLTGKTRDIKTEDLIKNILKTKASPGLSSFYNLSPPADPRRWTQFLGDPLVSQKEDQAWKVAAATHGIPLSETARRYMIGLKNNITSSYQPMNVGSMLQEIEQRREKGDITAEDQAYIISHLLINTAGVGVMNVVDPNRKPTKGVMPKKSRSKSYNPYGGLTPLRELQGLRPLKEL